MAKHFSFPVTGIRSLVKKFYLKHRKHRIIFLTLKVLKIFFFFIFKSGCFACCLLDAYLVFTILNSDLASLRFTTFFQKSNQNSSVFFHILEIFLRRKLFVLKLKTKAFPKLLPRVKKQLIFFSTR